MADSIDTIGLFAGVGMLDAGFALAAEYLGWAHRCVGFVERDAYAASILLGRMEDAALEPAPVFCGDIQDVDGSQWRGRANLWLVGGFPCQDISVAGKQAGIIEGKRSGLWREYVRLIRESDCAGVFIENVAALVSNGLDVVLGDLAALGFDAEWGSFRASDVGAPHRRERVFILAHRAQRGQRIGGQSPECHGQPDGGNGQLSATGLPEASAARNDGRVLGAAGSIREGARDCSGNDPMADASIESEREQDNPQLTEPRPRPRPRPHAGGQCGGVADAEHSGRGTQDAGRETVGRAAAGRPVGESCETPCRLCGYRFNQETLGKYGCPNCCGEGLGDPGEPGRQGRQFAEAFTERTGPSRSIGESDIAPFPPSPADRDAWAGIIARHPELAPAVEPGVCVLVDGLAVVVDESRADQLRCTGNGVVALQAAYAACVLAERLGLT